MTRHLPLHAVKFPTFGEITGNSPSGSAMDKLILWDRVSLCDSSWPRTRYAAQGVASNFQHFSCAEILLNAENRGI